MSDDLISIIRKHAIKNAFDYGKADSKSIIGKVIAEFPAAKSEFAKTMQVIEEQIASINLLSKESIAKELSLYHFEAKKIEERKLPDLKDAIPGKVIMRLAPNPNGPLHIGHSRMVILNDEYRKKYNATLILRYDDTDPKNENKRPMKEAYDWIPEDLKWLGVEFHRIERASNRLPIYYEYCRQVLEKGFGFVCTCSAETWSDDVRVARKACPCKSNSSGKNLELWNKMLAWELKQGEAVVRIKTDPNEKNPAVVDWPAFRIVDDPEHPIADKSVKVWPMLDFASAIDDFEFKITHILRGKDLMVSEFRQKILYSYFGWKYPQVILYGKFMTTEDLIIAKSKIKPGVLSGAYSGFDDPLLATLRGLKRRGILPQAIRNYILNLGISESETTVDLNILFAENRKLVEGNAKHYFFVEDPVVLETTGLQISSLSISRHHANESLGKREVFFDNEFLISKSDAENLAVGEIIRLKDLANFKILAQANGKVIAEFAGNELIKTSKKLQWVSAKPGENHSAELMFLSDSEGRPQKIVRKGFCEKECSQLNSGEIIQFERIGFAILDDKKDRKFICGF